MCSLRIRLAALSPWQRVALAAWTAIAVLAVGRAALIAYPRHSGCYRIFADAGRHWLAGTDLYTPWPGLNVFRYSPLVAAFLVPFGVLPDMLGSALLRLVNLGVFCAGFAWWTWAGVPAKLTRGQQAALWLLAMPLAVHSLVDVQTNALTTGLLLLGMTTAAQARWNGAAVFLLLACAIKVYPIVLVLLLIVIFPRHLALRIILATAVVGVLPVLLQRPDYVGCQYGDWARWGLNDRHADTAAIAFRDVRLLCRMWLAPLSDRGCLVAQLASVALIAGLCLLQRRRNVAPRRLLATLFGLGCGWMMVFGPATEHTTHIILAPALAWAVLDGWLSGRSVFYRLATLVSFALFAATQLCLWFPGGSRLHQLAPHPVAGLLLMGAFAATALRRPHIAASDPVHSWAASRQVA